MPDSLKHTEKNVRNKKHAKGVLGGVGLAVLALILLVFGVIVLLFMWQVNPLFKYWFESTSGPLGKIFLDVVSAASDALFGWIW